MATWEDSMLAVQEQLGSGSCPHRIAPSGDRERWRWATHGFSSQTPISFNPNILNHKVLQLEFISGIGMWLVADCWQIKKEIRPIVLESIYFCKINK